MNVEIRMGRCKWDSIILIDGQPVKRGILDFSVDVSDDLPTITLKVAPERLAISGELGLMIERDMRARSWRSHAGIWARYCLCTFFQNIRRAKRDLVDLWHRAHPENDDPICPAL